MHAREIRHKVSGEPLMKAAPGFIIGRAHRGQNRQSRFDCAFEIAAKAVAFGFRPAKLVENQEFDVLSGGTLEQSAEFG
jgi:hypothetical protein